MPPQTLKPVKGRIGRDLENRNEPLPGDGSPRIATPTIPESFDKWFVERIKERILWYSGFRRMPVWLLGLSLLGCGIGGTISPILAGITGAATCAIFVWPGLSLPLSAFTWWFSGIPVPLLLIKQAATDAVVISGQCVVDILRGKLQ